MTSNEEVTERWIPSHLQFRIAYWSCESCRIINLKKQAMQIMTFNKYSVHCEPLFKEKYQKSKIHLVSTAWNFRIEPYETGCHITMRAISCEPCMQPVITLLFYNFDLNGSCLSFETFNDNFPLNESCLKSEFWNMKKIINVYLHGKHNAIDFLAVTMYNVAQINAIGTPDIREFSKLKYTHHHLTKSRFQPKYTFTVIFKKQMHFSNYREFVRNYHSYQII